jgi:DNA-directed RNA polymerase subunit N (RpoN/RPB10)
MAMPVGRSEKRITKKIMVELARPDAPQLKETAVTQNLSACGMRVATKHFWRPGDRVLLTESGIRIEARVVLSALGKRRFCCRFGTFGSTDRTD